MPSEMPTSVLLVYGRSLLQAIGASMSKAVNELRSWPDTRACYRGSAFCALGDAQSQPDSASATVTIELQLRMELLRTLSARVSGR